MEKDNKKNNTFLLLKEVWKHLSFKRKKQFIILATVMILSAFSEVVGLGILLPFVAILTKPEMLLEHNVSKYAMRFFEISDVSELLLPLTILLVGAALFSGALRLLQLWLNGKLAHLAGADISGEIYRRTLYQPYSVHMSRNGSKVISGLTMQVNGTVVSFYYFLTLVSSTVLFAVMTIALVAINYKVAFIVGGVCAFFYILLSKFTRKKLRRNSNLISEKQKLVIKTLQEGLGGIRDILLDGTQSVYCKIYEDADKELRDTQGRNLFINGSPRFIMETMGIILIAILSFVLHRQEGGLVGALPLLATLAVGAQRLLPAMQLMFAMWSAIEANHAALKDTVEFLNQPVTNEVTKQNVVPLELKTKINFNNVKFKYNENHSWIIDGFNLEIPKGSRVGFVGETGSGKSTILDILMCLLQPQEGSISVDEQEIKGDLIRRWQKAIAHVPQNIFLSDATLAENIAFGVPASEIDHELIKKVSRQARVSDFAELKPEGYNVFVGERGVRLSGGQRQRIGIARALYKQASVLVFDEATSALDSMTEKNVMNSIENLNRDLTILIIAHRLSTIQNCDFIVLVESGRVAATGTYKELSESNSTFREMVNFSS